MILDTTYMISLLEREEVAFRRGMELYEEGTARRVSVATVFELFYGAAVSLDDDERRQVRNVIMGYPAVPVDEEVSRLATELLGRADRNAGGPEQSGVETQDAYIAATACAYNEPVLTRNVDDFEKLGVDVETY
jgi:predicted nucleic acid-binding protein